MTSAVGLYENGVTRSEAARALLHTMSDQAGGTDTRGAERYHYRPRRSRFDPETKEAVLVSFHPLSASSAPEQIAEVVAESGWPLRVKPDCGPTPKPTPEELALLRSLDPDRVWLGRG